MYTTLSPFEDDFIMNFLSFIEKIFNSKIIDKNIFIALLLVVIIGLNLLGIDLEKIQQSSYILTILVVVNIIISIVLYPITNFYLKSIKIYLEKLEKLTIIIEKTKEDYDFIKSKINFLESTLTKNGKILLDLNEELKGLPNIKYLRSIFELRTKSLWSEIFKECLQYTLLFHQESSAVVLESFNTNFVSLQQNYINFINQNIKVYNIENNLTIELNNKINNIQELIVNELINNKKTDEKLYIISIILKNMQDDINILIIDFLRQIQANIF